MIDKDFENQITYFQDHMPENCPILCSMKRLDSKW